MLKKCREGQKTCMLSKSIFEGLVRENKYVNFRQICIFFIAVISPLSTGIDQITLICQAYL